jgi:hypothetical protein
MNERAEFLPESLLWADGGHLSDEALSAYVDGQMAILPAAALSHVEGCDGCTGRLGTLSLAAWALEGAVREAVVPAVVATTTPSSPPSVAFRPPPWWAVAAALALAALTSLPSLGSLVQWCRTAFAVWPRVVPQLPGLGETLRGTIAQALGPFGQGLSLLVSLVLLLSGWAVASATLKVRSQKGTMLP